MGEEQRFIAGTRIPLNRAGFRHRREQSAPAREDKQLAKTLEKLEKTRDKLTEGSNAWKQADKAVQSFKRRNGI